MNSRRIEISVYTKWNGTEERNENTSTGNNYFESYFHIRYIQFTNTLKCAIICYTGKNMNSRRRNILIYRKWNGTEEETNASLRRGQ